MPYKDPSRQKQAQQEHYQKNKAKFLERQWVRRSIVTRTVLEAKFGKACTECGETHPACLDFHHVDPGQKVANVAAMRQNGWTREQVLSELEKCVLLCANCHRKLHYDSGTGAYAYLVNKHNMAHEPAGDGT